MTIRHPLTTVDSASLNDLFKQIDGYQRLGPNWDGEDALPVDRKVASRAKSLLQRIVTEVSPAENFFRLYGTTLEDLVRAGWRIVRIPLAAFTVRNFVLRDPDDIGHLNVFGSVEEFARYTSELSKCAELLTADQCLQR